MQLNPGIFRWYAASLVNDKTDLDAELREDVRLLGRLLVVHWLRTEGICS